jgi:hypothetical protein
VASLVAALSADLRFEWRHVPGAAEPASAGGSRTLGLGGPQLPHEAQREERRMRLLHPPAIPALPWDQVRRWTLSPTWAPTESELLVRHRRIDGGARVITNHRTPPRGYEIEYDLGWVRRFQPPGVAELRRGGPAGFFVLPDTTEGAPALTGPRHPDCLGFVEQAPFPLLDTLELAFHPETEQWTLVCGPEDPLAGAVTQRSTIGWVEAYPNRPRAQPTRVRPYGLAPLLRTVDHGARRHRYGIGEPPAGQLSLELGLVHRAPQDGSVPLWVHDGRVHAEALADGARADLAGGLRWAAAPLAWRDLGPLGPRLRASARRTVLAVRGSKPAAPQVAAGPATRRLPVGQRAARHAPRLRRVASRDRRPATHPVAPGSGGHGLR